MQVIFYTASRKRDSYRRGGGGGVESYINR